MSELDTQADWWGANHLPPIRRTHTDATTPHQLASLADSPQRGEFSEREDYSPLEVSCRGFVRRVCVWRDQRRILSGLFKDLEGGAADECQ